MQRKPRVEDDRRCALHRRRVRRQTRLTASSRSACCATTRRSPARAPHMQTYELEEADGMTLFIALNEIREKQDAVAAVRLRLPRRHLRQLRDGDQRAAQRSPAAR